jgi:adenylosuccinate synthase
VVGQSGLGISKYFIIGVLKSYFTRVGSGPLPTEIFDDNPFLSVKNIRERGTTTGRERRIGWFDLVLAKYAVKINAVDIIALTKIDILDNLDEIFVCTDYKRTDEKTLPIPVSPAAWEKVKPVYKKFTGWKSSTKNIKDWDNLPSACKDYILFLEESLKRPIGLISNGPERKDMILRGELLTCYQQRRFPV